MKLMLFTCSSLREKSCNGLCYYLFIVIIIIIIIIRSPTDSSTHDYILLRAEVSSVKDVKKPYSIRLACKGVREIFLAADEEEDQVKWILKLENASKRGKGPDNVH